VALAILSGGANFKSFLLELNGAQFYLFVRFHE
jgi:hypothetical protein